MSEYSDAKKRFANRIARTTEGLRLRPNTRSSAALDRLNTAFERITATTPLSDEVERNLVFALNVIDDDLIPASNDPASHPGDLEVAAGELEHLADAL